MKKLILATVLCLTAIYSHASITLNLNTGVMYESNGTTPVSDGTLLQLIADVDGTGFSAPSTTDFVTGTNLLLASFDVQSGTIGFAGGNTEALAGLNFSGNWGQGDDLLLRWYPSLTLGSGAPGAGTSYGEFRSDSAQDGATIGWITPADGSTNTINFITQSVGGSNPESAGAASFTTIPEPSSFLFLGLAGLAGMAFRRRK